VPRLGLDELPADLGDALRPRVDRLGYLGEFFQVAAHQPDALLGFVHFTESLKASLPAEVTETVALTVASLTGNRYERHQHERLALALGLGEAWVREVLRLEPGVAELDERERRVQALVLAAVGSTGREVDAELTALAEVADDAIVVGVLLTTGRYLAHALVANAFRLAPPVESPLEPA
jgi:alkylhydroperoxidase family enzyme